MKQLLGLLAAAAFLIAGPASAGAPRDIAFDDTRVFPESLGANHLRQSLSSYSCKVMSSRASTASSSPATARSTPIR
jgi:hypothetical protein